MIAIECRVIIYGFDTGPLSRYAVAQELSKMGHHYIMSVKADNEAWLFTNHLHTSKQLKKGNFVMAANESMVAVTWWAKKKSGAQKINFLTNMSSIFEYETINYGSQGMCYILFVV